MTQATMSETSANYTTGLTTQHMLETQPLPCLLRYLHPPATTLHTPETQARTFSTDPEMHATPKRQHSSPAPSQRPTAPRQLSTGSAAPYPKQKTGTAKHRRPGHRRSLNNAMRRPSTGTRRPERAPLPHHLPVAERGADTRTDGEVGVVHGVEGHETGLGGVDLPAVVEH